MGTLAHKIKTALRMLACYKNWPAVFLYRLGVRPQAMLVRLREGSVFRVRDRAAEISDLYVINESYLYGVHDGILPYLKSAKVGIDIGAHIGTFAVYAARHSPATVFAYEPFARNFPLLEENIALNDLQSRVIPVPAAVSGKAGELTLYVSHDSGLTTAVESHAKNFSAQELKTIRVPAVTLEDAFRKNNISFCDFIKMDCEGSEYAILYATPDAVLKRIGILTIELHGGGTLEELSAFLKSKGFEIRKPSREFAEILCINRAVHAA